MLDIQGIIRHLKAMGIGILITDHNVRETLKITDRAYIINNGEILRTGDPAELADDPQVRKIYLGEDFTSLGSVRHGARTETLAQAGAEAGDDAVAAAGDQAAADDAHGARERCSPRSWSRTRCSRSARTTPEEKRRRPREEAAEPPAPEATPAETTERERDSMDDIDLEAYFGDYWDRLVGAQRRYEEREAPPLENSLTREPDLYDHLLWQLHMCGRLAARCARSPS